VFFVPHALSSPHTFSGDLPFQDFRLRGNDTKEHNFVNRISFMLIDTHVHIHFPDFKGETDVFLDRARQAGVHAFVNVGTDVATSKEAIKIAEQHKFVFATVGIHPHDAKNASDEELQEIENLSKHEKVVAIGEVGLDYYKNHSPRDIQKKVLVAFFDMAKRTDLPLVLHIRDAYEEMIELLKAHFEPPIRAVSHCFSGTPEVMEELLALGLFISFAGPVTYKKNDALREAARLCPDDRIVVETDAPFLAPQAYRGKRNESSFMIETAKRIAELKGISLEEFGERSSRNAETLFGQKGSSLNL
jgi:TatD DNase family protein